MPFLAPPQIFVHILSYDSLRETESCLLSVLNQEGFSCGESLQIRVTENSPKVAAEDIEKLRSRFPGVEVIHSTVNTGYSRGHNIALQAAIHMSACATLLLNPDVVLDKSALRHMLSALLLSPDVGAVTPKIFRSQTKKLDQEIIDAAGMYFTSSGRHFDRGSGEKSRGEKSLGKFEEMEYVPGGTGACLLLRTTMLPDIALPTSSLQQHSEIFDERFFAYREDADLAIRMLTLGWKTVFQPLAQCWHERKVLPETRGTLPAELNAYSVRNRFLLQHKNRFPYDIFFFHKILSRNLLVIAAVALKEKSSKAALNCASELSPLSRRLCIWLGSRRRVHPFDLWSSLTTSKPLVSNIPGTKRTIHTITAIVVNYNCLTDLKILVRALQNLHPQIEEHYQLHIVVVDNASTDESAEWLRANLSNRSFFTLLISEKNLGFAGAINRAAKEAPADAFLILNPDIDLGGDTVLRLAHTLERNQSIALVAPVLINSDRTPQTGFMARRLPTMPLLALELFGIHKLWKSNPWSSWHRYSPSLELSLLTNQVEKNIFAWRDHPVDIEQPAGACMLVCAKVFNEIGGMDESFYPAWFEDVDLCKRLKEAGHRCCILPDSIAIHRGGASLESMPRKKFQAIFLNNMLLYSRKHFSRIPALTMEVIIPLSWLIRSVVLKSEAPIEEKLESPPAKITLK